MPCCSINRIGSGAYLRRLDRAEAIAKRMGWSRETLRGARAPVGARNCRLSEPALYDLYDAIGLLDLSQGEQYVDPTMVRTALSALLSQEKEPRPAWVAADEAWPPADEDPQAGASERTPPAPGDFQKAFPSSKGSETAAAKFSKRVRFLRMSTRWSRCRAGIMVRVMEEEAPSVFTLEAVNALVPRLRVLMGAQMERRSEIERRLEQLAPRGGRAPDTIQSIYLDPPDVRQLKSELVRVRSARLNHPRTPPNAVHPASYPR